MEGNSVNELLDLSYLPSYTEQDEQEERSIEDYLDELCAYYMHLGMSYDDFWNGDYTALKYWREKYYLDIEARNQELWLQGAYNCEAVTVAVYNNFKKPGSPNRQYVDKPHRITPLTEREKEEEKKKQVEDFRNALMALGSRFERKHALEKEGVKHGS